MTTLIGWQNDLNASAALLVDGRVVGAVEEERFTRLKQQEGFPARSVEWLLARAGLLPNYDSLAATERRLRDTLGSTHRDTMTVSGAAARDIGPEVAALSRAYRAWLEAEADVVNASRGAAVVEAAHVSRYGRRALDAELQDELARRAALRSDLALADYAQLWERRLARMQRAHGVRWQVPGLSPEEVRDALTLRLIEMLRASPEQRAQFEALPDSPVVPSYDVLSENANPELASAWVTPIDEEWRRLVLTQ